MDTTASSSFSTSLTIKINGIDDHTSINRKDLPLISSNCLEKEIQEKSTHLFNNNNNNSNNNNNDNNNIPKRRNRPANGTIIRSKSFDNGKYGIGHRKSLNKSKTLSSISYSMTKKRCVGNGSAECLNEKHRENKRRRIQSFVDQSPLWHTLTHARTISDFSIES